MNRKLCFGVLGVIVAISFIAATLIPAGERVKGIIAAPGVLGLLTALFQIVRDDAAFQRATLSQQRQQLFSLGATSHMANCVFDKHVEFCEKYLTEVHQAVVTLTKEGPTKLALEHSSNLYRLRIDYTAWITPEMERKLIPFETLLREIGANSSYIEALSGNEDKRKARSKAIESMFDSFSSLLDFDETIEKNEDATVTAVKDKIREILQVNELISIREYLVVNASNMTKE